MHNRYIIKIQNTFIDQNFRAIKAEKSTMLSNKTITKDRCYMGRYNFKSIQEAVCKKRIF